MARVVFICRDPAIGEPIAREIEEHAFDVTWCPGPQPPDCVCGGIRHEHCPLPAEADAVVLDGWLESDALRAGTPSWHLLLFYRSLKLPVVVLIGPDGLPGPLRDPNVEALPRTTTPRTVAEAVERAIRRGRIPARRRL